MPKPAPDSSSLPPRSNAVSFRLNGGVVRVESARADLIEAARRLFPAYAIEGSTIPPDDVLALEQASDVWWVASAAGHREQFATRAAALDALEYLVAARLLSLARDFAHLHAAGAVTSGATVLAVGASGSGKSSIALHWSQHGVQVMGDDIVLIGVSGEAHPFRRLFKVDRRRLALYGATPVTTGEAVAEEMEVWYDPAPAGGWAEPAPVGTVAFIQRDPEVPDVQLERLAASEALNLALRCLLPTGVNGARSFARMAKMVEGAHVARLTFADAARAATILLDLM